MTLEGEEIAALRVENAALPDQVQGLLAEVQQLRGQLAKDSRNSSKPPSSDGLARKTKSLREKSGKKPGGQPGHRGQQVPLVEAPDQVVVHRPQQCGSCQQVLPDEALGWIERRQVHELPPVRLQVTEHHIPHVRCPRYTAAHVCRCAGPGTQPGMDGVAFSDLSTGGRFPEHPTHPSQPPVRPAVLCGLTW
jgi:hypothetical protein